MPLVYLLAGHLLTLRPGLLALPDHKILGVRLFDGLSDTLRILVDAAGGAAPAQVAQLQEDLASACDSRPTTLTAAQLCLNPLAKLAAEVASGLNGEPESQAKWWASALARQCQTALDELIFLAPWTLLATAPDRLSDFPGIDAIPTLRELARLQAEVLPAIEHRLGSDATPEESEWLDELQRLIPVASHRAKDEDRGHRTACTAIQRTRQDGV